jgi:hypothetical protein
MPAPLRAGRVGAPRACREQPERGKEGGVRVRLGAAALGEAVQLFVAALATVAQLTGADPDRPPNAPPPPRP